MNPEVKKLWVAALRSGEYKQGPGYLHWKDDYCCLGVLCDLHRKANPENDWNHLEPDSYLGELSILPRTVAEWAGLDSANPKIGSAFATEHNDGDGTRPSIPQKDFNQIADLIERNL